MSFNRPPSLPRDPSASQPRPTLWVEGSQRPRFDVVAFARVSLVLSRRSARPALDWLAGKMSDAAESVGDNTLGPRLARTGRIGRALPSRGAVAQGLSTMARLLSAAADVALPPVALAAVAVVPQPAAPLPLPMPARRAIPRIADQSGEARPPTPQPQRPVQSRPRPEATVPSAAAPDFDSKTLTAIRALIDEMHQTTPVAPHRAAVPARPTVVALPLTGRALLTGHVPLQPPEPEVPTLSRRLRSAAHTLLVAAIGWGATLLASPVGAVKAALIHLNGSDLRTWS